MDSLSSFRALATFANSLAARSVSPFLRSATASWASVLTCVLSQISDLKFPMPYPWTNPVLRQHLYSGNTCTQATLVLRQHLYSGNTDVTTSLIVVRIKWLPLVLQEEAGSLGGADVVEWTCRLGQIKEPGQI